MTCMESNPDLMNTDDSTTEVAIETASQGNHLTPDEVEYGVSQWPEAGRGNHRALAEVWEPADAVRLHIPWRRRDHHPEAKAIVVYDSSTGKRVTNVAVVEVNRIYGEIVFQPTTTPCYYEIYYLPYNPSRSPFGDPGTYFEPQDTADPEWRTRSGVDAAGLACGQWRKLPEAKFLMIEARGEFHRFDPMEVIATEEETRGLLARHANADFLIFPEDRRHPIKMTRDLPLRWIKNGPSVDFEGQAQPGEFYVFQIGIHAVSRDLDSIEVEFRDACGPSEQCLGAAAMRCLNAGGVDWMGRKFTKTISVAQGTVLPLWIGIQVPSAASGCFEGEVCLRVRDCETAVVRWKLRVSGSRLDDGGVSDLWRLSRLKWLDSTLGIDKEVVAPFEPVSVEGSQISILGRSHCFNGLGLPASIKANDTELLSDEIQFAVRTPDAPAGVMWTGSKTEVIESCPAFVIREATAIAGNLRLAVRTKSEFDGAILFEMSLTADEDRMLDDVSLLVPLRREATPYMMGFGKEGGRRPESWDWHWDVNRANHMVWLGDVHAGIQCKLLHEQDTWDLLDMKGSGIPESWGNAGHGGACVREEGDRVFLRVFSGRRNLRQGETVRFRCRLLVTPFKPINPDHWNWRFGDIDQGATIGHLHTGTLLNPNNPYIQFPGELNPYINYPFLTVPAIRNLVEKLKAKGAGINFYYTLRELSNHAVELWALRSLGDEIFQGGQALVYFQEQAEARQSGGGYPWLMEHLEDGYVPAWREPLASGETDASIAMQGLSRWHNYYIESLPWLMRQTGFDGLYLDGIGFDREVMKRVAKAMRRTNPESRIDFHSGNNFEYLDLRVSPMNQYMEHLPYLSSLWFGEAYDYDKPPDYWLIEMSGLPFGLTNQILQPGRNVNPWRAMLHAGSARYHPSSPGLWKVWDRFGIDHATIDGYWSSECPVRTGREDVLATVYRRSDGSALIALASWSETDMTLRLEINWEKLGIDPAAARIEVPEIPHFQDSANISAHDEIRIPAKKGVLILVNGPSRADPSNIE